MKRLSLREFAMQLNAFFWLLYITSERSCTRPKMAQLSQDGASASITDYTPIKTTLYKNRGQKQCSSRLLQKVLIKYEMRTSFWNALKRWVQWCIYGWCICLTKFLAESLPQSGESLLWKFHKSQNVSQCMIDERMALERVQWPWYSSSQKWIRKWSFNCF